MISNFIKSAFRNLWKTKGYSFLNIFGLALGIAVTAFIFLWVEDEVTYNANFKNQEDIYIVKSIQKYDGQTFVFGATQGPLAAAIKEEIPGIKHAARYTWGDNMLFNNGEDKVSQFGYYVDPSFIEILSPEFVEGSQKTAFTQLNNIVLSESVAQKFFAGEKALGKTIELSNGESYIVSAVTKDFPENADLRYDFLLDFKKFELANEWLKSYSSNGLQTIVQVAENADLSQINKQLLKFVEKKTNGEVTFSENFLYPMTRWHLYNVFDSSGIEKDGAIKNVRLFSTIAWLILIIACINFMNLSTARSEKRAKEVGMRKIVGATKRSLILQFLGESLIYAFVSGGLALFFIWLGLKPFNTLIGKELQLNLGSNLHLGFFAGIILLCGLVAGSYPAFFLSSFKPLNTLKGGTSRSLSAGLVRKILVVIQFSAAIILIIANSIIYLQINSAKNRDVGFDRSQVITTNLRSDMTKHLPYIKDKLIATGAVEAVGVSKESSLRTGSNTSNFDWDGKNKDQAILINWTVVDDDFIPALGMKMADGRNFNMQNIGDSTSVVVNESFAKLVKPDGQIAGQVIQMNGQPITVVGVVKDYVYNNAYANIEPLVLFPFYETAGVLNIRTKAGVDIQEAIQKIETVIKEQSPGYPFNYRFLDESFNNMFFSEVLLQKLASLFGILAIIISCLGLFGLASYAAEQRAREVSIRKVLGASVLGLVKMLNKEFILLVVISCLIAFPIAYFYMNDWLKNFQYHINIPWAIFLISGLVAIGIALLTISSQALKAAWSNPTKTLRNE